MKKILIKPLFFSLLLITSFANATYYEGIDYVKLDKPVPTTTGDKIEVRELFWYYCPHCYNLEPLMKNWLTTKPKNVEFIRQPAVFSKRWLSGAVYFYTLKELGLLEKLHEQLFDAIHKHDKKFSSEASFVNWVASFGVKKTEIEKIMKSFAMRIHINKATINTNKYKATGVPAIIVNGKYLANATYAGNHQEMLKVVNHLIKKESKK